MRNFDGTLPAAEFPINTLRSFVFNVQLIDTKLESLVACINPDFYSLPGKRDNNKQTFCLPQSMFVIEINRDSKGCVASLVVRVLANWKKSFSPQKSL